MAKETYCIYCGKIRDAKLPELCSNIIHHCHKFGTREKQYRIHLHDKKKGVFVLIEITREQAEMIRDNFWPKADIDTPAHFETFSIPIKARSR